MARLLLACLLLVPAAGCGGSQLRPGYAVAAEIAVRVPTRLNPPGPSSSPASRPQSAPRAEPGAGATPSGGPARTGVAGPSSVATPATPAPDPRAQVAAAGAPAPGRERGRSCQGLKDQTGVTATTITVANIADVSGPIPGIFLSAQQAVRAYFAYFNATSSVCGRSLELLPLDSHTDPAGDQQATVKACEQAFAAVGSMAAFDSGGAGTAQQCGLPDLRAMAVSDARNACSTCFGAQATDFHAFQNAVPDFFTEHYREATQHAGILYVNAAASVENAQVQKKIETKRGWRFVFDRSFDIAEFNYSPYVQRMKAQGVRLLEFVGSQDEAVRLAHAMQEANYAPTIFLLDPTSYSTSFASAGSAVDGAVVYLDFALLSESARNPELGRYEQWLQRVAPGAEPSYFGVFAWSAAKLFAEQATALGGDLSRASLTAAVRRVHHWTAAGLHAPQDVGGKINSGCWRFVRLEHGAWVPFGGRQYLCRGSTVIP